MHLAIFRALVYTTLMDSGWRKAEDACYRKTIDIRIVTEAKYLNADNADRYRSIMRIFYENYEKLRYWMYQEEVYAQMTADPYFADYRMEQCQQDLAMLTEWKNLNTIQDTRRGILQSKNLRTRSSATRCRSTAWRSNVW